MFRDLFTNILLKYVFLYIYKLRNRCLVLAPKIFLTISYKVVKGEPGCQGYTSSREAGSNRFSESSPIQIDLGYGPDSRSYHLPSHHFYPKCHGTESNQRPFDQAANVFFNEAFFHIPHPFMTRIYSAKYLILFIA